MVLLLNIIFILSTCFNKNQYRFSMRVLLLICILHFSSVILSQFSFCSWYPLFHLFETLNWLLKHFLLFIRHFCAAQGMCSKLFEIMTIIYFTPFKNNNYGFYTNLKEYFWVLERYFISFSFHLCSTCTPNFPIVLINHSYDIR